MGKKTAKSSGLSAKDGTCASQGYTDEKASETKNYPGVGDVKITHYKKATEVGVAGLIFLVLMCCCCAGCAGAAAWWCHKRNVGRQQNDGATAVVQDATPIVVPAPTLGRQQNESLTPAQEPTNKAPTDAGRTVTVIMKPGKIGMNVDPNTGIVHKVYDSLSQAATSGIQVGWQIVKINAKAYSESELDRCIAGTNEYMVILKVTVPQDVQEEERSRIPECTV